jgi:hypothetical protein
LHHRLRLIGLCGNLGHRLPAVHPGLAADEGPDKIAEAPDIEHGLRIRDRRLDLQPISHDGRVANQSLDVARPIACHLFGLEAGERAAVALPLVQDRRP